MSTLEMGYEDVLKAVEGAERRAKKATYLEAKKELSEETYPLMSMIVEFFGERMERVERAVAEMIDQTESFVQPELAEQVLQTVELARALAQAVTKLKSGQIDVMTLKRMQSVAQSLLVACQVTEEQIVAVTVEAGPATEEPEEGDEEGDGDGEEEPEGDEPPAEEETVQAALIGESENADKPEGSEEQR